jgi:hypothetical protein
VVSHKPSSSASIIICELRIIECEADTVVTGFSAWVCTSLNACLEINGGGSGSAGRD